MYQYSRAIYRSIKSLIDPYADRRTQLEYRRAVLCECEQTMERLADEHTRQVVAHLRAAGYRPGSGVPVVLVGLSGGAQTALRVASEVARSLGGAPLDVVTFGAFADGSADLEGIRRVHAVVSGSVQGVGFRYWTARKADGLELVGYARNLFDGTVEVDGPTVFTRPTSPSPSRTVMSGRIPSLLPASSVTVQENVCAAPIAMTRAGTMR